MLFTSHVPVGWVRLLEYHQMGSIPQQCMAQYRLVLKTKANQSVLAVDVQRNGTPRDFENNRDY